MSARNHRSTCAAAKLLPGPLFSLSSALHGFSISLLFTVALVGVPPVAASGQSAAIEIVSPAGYETGFGSRLAIDGDLLAISAPAENTAYENAGSVYVYRFASGEWVLEDRLTTGEAGDSFTGLGFSVGVRRSPNSPDGDIVVAGTLTDATGGAAPGSIFVFRHDSGIWTLVQRLPGEHVSNSFFKSVTLGDKWLTVSGRTQTQNMFWVFDDVNGSFELSDSLVFDYFLDPPLVDGDWIIAGLQPLDPIRASIVVWGRHGGGWQMEGALPTPSTVWAGSALALRDSTVLARSYDDSCETHCEGVYVFQRTTSGWQQEDEIESPPAQAPMQFGKTLALWDDNAFVGAPGDGELGSRAGAIYVFSRQGSGWSPIKKLTVPGGVAGDKVADENLVASDRFVATKSARVPESIFVFDWRTAVRVHPSADWPERPSLTAPYPNPFASSTHIGFNLSLPSRVRISVHDVLGREVARLVDGICSAGHHETSWQPTGAGGGLYIIVYESNGVQQSMKVILAR